MTSERPGGGSAGGGGVSDGGDILAALICNLYLFIWLVIIILEGIWEHSCAGLPSDGINIKRKREREREGERETVIEKEKKRERNCYMVQNKLNKSINRCHG